MNTVIIIAQEYGKTNKVAQISISNNEMKIEKILLEWKHSASGLSNDEVINSFNFIDCYKTGYELLLVGQGFNYSICFLEENEVEAVLTSFRNTLLVLDERKVAKENEKIELENNRKEAVFAKAKESGVPQILSSFSYDSQDKEGYVQVINEVSYAMPDGSIEFTDNETN
jgi:hypothetical protein